MKRTLVDVLTDAIARPDGCVVPRIDLWGVAMRPSDVQKPPQREFTGGWGSSSYPRYLFEGMGPLGSQERPYLRFPKDLVQMVGQTIAFATGGGLDLWHNKTTRDGPAGPHTPREHTMDATTATDLITTAKDDETEITVRLVDGTEITGRPISVNSKGVNIEVDGKVRSFGLKRVDALLTDTDIEEEAETADRIEELANEVSDGATTAEVAALLSDYLSRDLTPKELRVHLRALGLGVGKGNKYALSEGEFRAVIRVINEADAVVKA